MYLSQAYYIDNLCAQFFPDSSSITTTKTPTASDFKDLGPRKPSEHSSPGAYSSLSGALLWVAQSTQSDILFAGICLSQFLCDPSVAHWYATLQVLRYLIPTKDLKLCLGRDIELSGYTDSNWAEDRFNRCSTLTYTFQIGSWSIPWKYQKQPTVSFSSTKAEHKALSDSCKEAIWLGNLLSEIHLCPMSPIPLRVENEGAEALAKNPEHHTCTKHINARYYFFRECVSLGRVKVCHVLTKDMIADMLTKPLSPP